MRNPAAPALRLGRLALSASTDWDGLFTVRSDRLSSGTGFAPEMVHKVSGESVGTPSDPS